MDRLRRTLVLAFLLYQAGCAREEPVTTNTDRFPPWDGKEAVVDYARRVGLEPAIALDLGDGVTLEAVLIPPGTGPVGLPGPSSPVEGICLIVLGALALGILLGPLLWRCLFRRRPFQYSLGRALLGVFAAGFCVWGVCDLISLRDRRDQASHALPLEFFTLQQPVYMGRYEVTIRQFEHVLKQPYEGMPRSDFSLLDPLIRPQLPVSCVSWIEANQFCAQVAETTGLTVRLPNEREWEYACRAGPRDEYSDIRTLADLDGVAWTWANCKFPQPVGRKRPNYFGLYDMLGNTREWCQDVNDEEDFYYRPKPSPFRVVRGDTSGSGKLGVHPCGRSRFYRNSRDAGFRVLLHVPDFSVKP